MHGSSRSHNADAAGANGTNQARAQTAEAWNTCISLIVIRPEYRLATLENRSDRWPWHSSPLIDLVDAAGRKRAHFDLCGPPTATDWRPLTIRPMAAQRATALRGALPSPTRLAD
jgi:hypothetical protein